MDATLDHPFLGTIDVALCALQKLEDEGGSHGSAYAKANERLVDLLVACGFPPAPEAGDHVLLPRPEDLTPTQREVALQLASRGPQKTEWTPTTPTAGGLPFGRAALRRWLELDPGLALETRIPFALEGPPRPEPLWRVMGLLRSQESYGRRMRAFTRTLPLSLRLRAMEETAFFGQQAAYHLEPSYFLMLEVPEEWAVLDCVYATFAPWAREVATRWSHRIAGSTSLPRAQRVFAAPDEVTSPLFAALLRAGETILPEWDCLLPGLFVLALPSPVAERALASLPPERRLAQALRLFETEFEQGCVLDVGLRVFAEQPHPKLERLLQLKFAEDSSRDAPVRARAKTALAALGKLARGPKPGARIPTRVALFELLTRTTTEITSATKLDTVQKKQIVATGEAYFGEKRPLKKLLAEGDEGDSFHEAIELRRVESADGSRAYDVVYVMGDSGLVFAADQTKQVAQIVQDGIEDCDDDALVAALENLLASGTAAAAKPATQKPGKKAPKNSGEKTPKK